MVVLLAMVGVLVYGLVAATAAEGVRRTLQEAVHVREEQQMQPGVYVVIYHDGEVESTRTLPPGFTRRGRDRAGRVRKRTAGGKD